jgi:hypothetical protein
MKDELVAVHADARAELLDQSFYAPDRFAERLEEHVTDPNFELVTGRAAGRLRIRQFPAGRYLVVVTPRRRR